MSSQLTDAGLTTDDYDDYEDIMINGTQAQKDNWTCWMKRYLLDHVACGACSCPDSDPFD